MGERGGDDGDGDDETTANGDDGDGDDDGDAATTRPAPGDGREVREGVVDARCGARERGVLAEG